MNLPKQTFPAGCCFLQEAVLSAPVSTRGSGNLGDILRTYSSQYMCQDIAGRLIGVRLV